MEANRTPRLRRVLARTLVALVLVETGWLAYPTLRARLQLLGGQHRRIRTRRQPPGSRGRRQPRGGRGAACLAACGGGVGRHQPEDRPRRRLA